MHIVINIAVTFALIFWPPMFMMSPMMFDAPGSENNKGTIIVMMLILCYPIGLFFLLGISGTQYFGMNGFKLTAISSAIIAVAFLIFGYYGLLFNAIRGIATSGYSVVDDTAYYDGKPIQGADTRSFTLLDGDEYRASYGYYARDKKHLYFAGKVVDDALSEDIHEIANSGGMYWHNSRQVIYDDKVLPGAIPENFTAFQGFTGWARSDNGKQFNVFSYGSQLPPVDRESFTPLDDFHAKDKHQIFFKNENILPQADAPSFELLADHDFGRDQHHVYYLSTKQPFAIEGADPDSFEVLDRGYAKDRSNIFVIEQYSKVEKLEQAHVDSFEVTQYDEANRSEARDVNHYYYDGKIVGNR